ncbi:hypothetical protein GCM10010981_18640 [Dyella nitratireducens]|uniref:Uncharacterized protein n=1 Tax=Dyella nitratireducens TaxID=1849580 RepID=A0ABQ1FT60_9GAMM|nr:hypothetical protein GCM10010981_18640 [Dyella nitratireducens]
MDMLPLPLLQALGTNRFDKPCGCAVKEHAWRRKRLQFQVHTDRMPLICTYPHSRIVEGKALLITAGDDVGNDPAIQLASTSVGQPDEIVNIGPTVLIQLKADRLRIMPEYQA